MSRSIHQNKSARYWRVKGWKELEDRADHAWRKRRTQFLVSRERRDRALPPRPAVGALHVPIRVRFSAPELYFPIPAADLELFLQTLVHGELAGIEEIEFDLGLQVCRKERRRHPSHVFDPWFRRPSYEWAPGLFMPILHGGYAVHRSAIALYGYACGSDLALSDEQRVDLELEFLDTVVHEIAHHEDAVRRSSRGRWWLSQDDAKDEDFAVRRAQQMIVEHVVPYLERRHDRHLF